MACVFSLYGTNVRNACGGSVLEKNSQYCLFEGRSVKIDFFAKTFP